MVLIPSLPTPAKAAMTLPLSQLATSPTWSEQKLVAATRAGDDRAFEQLYARYRERIFSFILSKIGDHGRAEDIAQDVFLSALRRLRASDQSISFKPWIYEIAKNACIDEYRRGSRSREIPLEADGEFVIDRQKTSISAVPTPAAAVESKQRLDDLRGAFGGLSTTHHQLLVMREFEGLSYDEIGERLNMTRQMVESGLFRARRKLGEEYAELASGQRCEQIQSAIEAGRLRAVSSLGLRDRRRFARHLAHCQPCRHIALMAGVDEALVKPRSIAAKIAALLPFPLWRLSWRSRGARAASTGSHHLAGGGAGGLVPSAGSAITLGQAAATVAAVLATAGGGLAVHGLGGGGSHVASPTSAPRTLSPGSSSATSAALARSRAGATAAGRRTAARSTHASLVSPKAPRHAVAKSMSARHPRRGSAPGAPGGGGSGSGGSGSGSSASSSHGAGTSSSGASKVVNGATKSVNGATKSVSGAAKTVSRVVNGVSTTVNGVTNGVSSTVNGVTNGVSSTVNGVTSGVSSTVNGVGSGVAKTVNGAATGVSSTVNGVAGGIGKTVSGVTGGSASGVTGGVSSTVKGATNGAGQTVNGAASGVGKTVNGAGSGAGQTVSGATSGVGKTVSGVSSGVAGTVTGGTGALGAGASGASGTSGGHHPGLLGN